MIKDVKRSSRCLKGTLMKPVQSSITWNDLFYKGTLQYSMVQKAEPAQTQSTVVS